MQDTDAQHFMRFSTEISKQVTAALASACACCSRGFKAHSDAVTAPDGGHILPRISCPFRPFLSFHHVWRSQDPFSNLSIHQDHQGVGAFRFVRSLEILGDLWIPRFPTLLKLDPSGW